MNKNKKTLFYISTNNEFGGSEELWLRSASSLKRKGFTVYTSTKYNDSRTSIGVEHINYHAGINFTVKERLLDKLGIKKFPPHGLLFQFIKENKPDLVIISQGNNVESLEIMRFCGKNGLKFITITQLVSELNFLHFNKENLSQYQSAYSNAITNYFVSSQNLNLNSIMLGIDLPNAAIVNNPCKVYGEDLVTFPDTKIYHVALVGRIEFYHKGYDLLLQVACNDKWRTRNIHFNFYGDGIHSELLKKNIERLKLSNVSIKGFTNNISELWAANHILCMPSRMEGQALALIEAMYFARTAIVTNVGGVRELILDHVNGFVARSATVEALDEALEHAWSKREDWARMGEASHKIILSKYGEPAEEILNRQIRNYVQYNTD